MKIILTKYNLIETIETNGFYGLANLKHLNLINNNIIILKDNSLSSLSNLESLIIENNLIQSIHF